MINLFFRNRRKGENALDLSEIKIIGEESRKMGIKTIGVVTLPFEFEGSRKFNQAAAGLAELAKNTDAMFVINNQYILNYHSGASVITAFSKADELMRTVMCSIIDFIKAKNGKKVGNGLIGYLKRRSGGHVACRAV